MVRKQDKTQIPSQGKISNSDKNGEGSSRNTRRPDGSRALEDIIEKGKAIATSHLSGC
ncbi:hypothetical protein BP00DRAFT_431211 [Aspergillus indologenus CBS 114.80]|uniref:Uncharacterized protein n=1 Tax=Aspergillus indologenus CBS 114.80 TaxID=1450541 RepID=A0A2V5HLX1_9EURO|nr:hypothetical protein BP00DRAFT_431211 [Aspergillus indologenus CBS 114.80]